MVGMTPQELDYFEITGTCTACDGTGYDPATKELCDNFHSGERWCHSLDQEEVDYLYGRGRLFDFTECPTVAEVNRWSYKGFSHDAVNRSLCTEFRARRSGFYGVCEACDGDGEISH